jgi:hypothetical protein
MSKSQIKHELKREIIKLNKTIDHKILRGLPYAREARAHKLLLARYAVLSQSSMIARSMRLVTMMMF